MNLAYPSALFWSLLAIPIVIFYILKIRLRRVPVSTILFWRQIFEEKQPRSIWQHLRHLLSLLIQIFFLLLLVFALAEPFFNWEILEARRLVLVVDNSASMNALDGDLSLSRLSRAKEEGRRVLEGLRFRDEVAIVAAGTQPQVVCGLTGHQKTLLKALDGIAPSDGPTRVQEAVELARRLLADQDNGKIILLSDGCFGSAVGDRPSAVGQNQQPIEPAADSRQPIADKDVQLILVGRRTGNVGISRFQARRSLLDPIGYEILVEVVNHSDETTEGRLEVDLHAESGKQTVDAIPLKLAPNQVWTRVFEKTSAEGGKLEATLNGPGGKEALADGLVADNQAVALLPRREMQPVLLVTPESNLFLEKVFEASPLVKLSVAKELPQLIPAGTLVVLHRAVPERLPAGRLFVIEPGGACDLWQAGDKLQNPIVTKQDKDSPLMAHVKLDNVLMPEARKLEFKTGSAGVPPASGQDGRAPVKVLVTALSGDPLYAALERPEGKLLVLTVNLDQGDLPLRTAFPIMVMNALGWFAGEKGELREALATGAVTEVELKSPEPAVRSAESKTAAWLLIAPDGQERRLPDGVTRTTVGPLDQCGVWKVGLRTPDSGLQTLGEIAVNLANRQESDLRPPESLLSNSKDSGAGMTGLVNRPIWFWLIATAWLLAGVEWYLYQRRWIS